jgi:predicted  nucleic acid-binding Zn-ribbon protein
MLEPSRRSGIAFIEFEYLIRLQRCAISEEPDNLAYLRRIDGKIDRLTDDVQDLKHRVTSLEGQVASIRADMAAISQRIDRIETRFDRMERRLDIIPEPAG